MKAKISWMVLGPVQTNCYIMENTETHEAVVVDPGDNGRAIYRHIEESGLELKGILLTHGHFDHILGLKDLISAVREAKGNSELVIPVYADAKEADLLSDGELNCSGGCTVKPDKLLSDREKFHLAGFEFVCLSTPGHTQGSCCFYVPAEKVLFSGDTLFAGSVGRTDLPTGSMGSLIRSIREKLLGLPDDTVVLPGHDSQTTMGDEKKYNPYFHLQ
ncbi:MAG: MBL fold metallo-hydrolase [Lachnospiraceae bacterium]|nr:MBL fold metallo-hydrolase [Lachnospiraceae bacterium]